MLSVDYSAVRDNLSTYCDKAAHGGETIVVTRGEEKNVVLMGWDIYEQLVKAIHNADYLAMIDQGIDQLSAGRGQRHELIECD